MIYTRPTVLEHAVFSVRLRAPRAAIVLPATANWQFIAATAIYRASQIWGGAGFILVPHSQGMVDAAMLRVVASYDPDHVVAISDTSLADLLEAGACEWSISDSILEPEKLRSRGDVAHLMSPYDNQAREAVVKACSPYRHGIRGESAHEDSIYLSVRPNSGPFRQVTPSGATEDRPLSCCDPLERDLALILADRYGILEKPASNFDPAKTLGQQALQALTNQEIDWRPQSAFVRWTSEKSRWSASLEGLTSVGSPSRDSTTWVILGSTFLDFALSYALSRVNGDSRWFPSEWASPTSPMRYFVDEQLFSLQYNDPSRFESVSITSTSMGIEQIRALIEEAKESHPVESHETQLRARPISDLGLGDKNTHLALKNDYDREIVLPVARSGPDAMSIWAVTAIPAITPETVVESDLFGQAIWHVDVEPHKSSMPRGRALAWESLQDPDAAWPERVRSGRDGLSIAAGSYGLVFGGSTLRQSLARPHLRFPTGLDWVVEIGRASKYDIAISDAGHKANVAASLWGGRRIMANSIAADRLMLMEFLTTKPGQTSADRYPLDDGVALRSEGFLTFEALVRAANSAADPLELVAIRERIDTWCAQEILRRGLILKCTRCDRIQWIDARRISELQCGRCQAQIPLSLGSWNLPISEPKWFYDLNPVIRELLVECGHVPVLAGRLIEDKIRGVAHVAPEIMFARKRKRQFEVDLLVMSANHLVVGECKNQPTVPRREHVRKIHALTESAQVFRADEIVLASGEGGKWESAFVTQLRERVNAIQWADGRKPKIALLDGVYYGFNREYVN